MEKKYLRTAFRVFLVGTFVGTSLYNRFDKYMFICSQEKPTRKQIQERERINQEQREKTRELSPFYRVNEIKLENLA